ncbi:MAG: hypothetical protein HWN66_21590, partial [Candidatus Helarchaeota archaeon]|nr:hypothetical protein [Candidatus Helarchaeota archaeon]
WTVMGMWAGAIERNPMRGLGVGAGIWLGWFILELIYLAITGFINLFLGFFLIQWFSLIIVILAAVVFGALTKSEEF